MPVIMRNGVPYGSGGINIELTQIENTAATNTNVKLKEE